MVTDLDALSAAPTYRAVVAAIDTDLDMALLWITQPADQSQLHLPTLPAERITIRELRRASLQVLGFPQGKSSLKEPTVDYYGAQEGAWEMEAPRVGNGYSGSPLLVARGDRHHIGGVVFYRADGLILVQPVRRLDSFRWDMAAPRLWVEDAQSMPANVGALHGLNLTVNIHAVDLAQRELQLIAVAYDPQGQPWPSADKQLTLQRTFEPARFVDVVPLKLGKPLAGLGRMPDRLRFVLQVWDVGQSELLWEESVYYLHPSELSTAPPTSTITPSLEPTDTSTPTARPTKRATATNTATPTATPTPIAPVIDPKSVPAMDMDGRFTLSGMAAPGDEVEIEVDGAVIGSTTADEDGRWTHRLAIDTPGRHVISVNAIIGELRQPGSVAPIPVVIAPTVTPISTRPQATLSPIPTQTRQASAVEDAAEAVVRILPQQCSDTDCQHLGVGSGVIIHPSGYILTAWHVTVAEVSDELGKSHTYADNFLIEMTEDLQSPPVSRYQARLVATHDEFDFAILKIDATNLGEPIANLDNLPTLAISEVTPNTAVLRIMGYPPVGGDSISYLTSEMSGFDENGALLKVQGGVSRGYSGGPALIERNGKLKIVGIAIRSRGQELETGEFSQEIGIFRSTDRLENLRWKNSLAPLWGTNVQVGTVNVDAERLLRFSMDLHALDSMDIDGLLLAYAFDAKTLQPWKPTQGNLPISPNGQLVFQQDFSVDKFVDFLPNLTMDVPLDGLELPLDKLVFRLMVWDVGLKKLRWQSPEWFEAKSLDMVPASISAKILLPSPNATETPLPASD